MNNIDKDYITKKELDHVEEKMEEIKSLMCDIFNKKELLTHKYKSLYSTLQCFVIDSGFHKHYCPLQKQYNTYLKSKREELQARYNHIMNII